MELFNDEALNKITAQAQANVLEEIGGQFERCQEFRAAAYELLKRYLAESTGMEPHPVDRSVMQAALSTFRTSVAEDVRQMITEEFDNRYAI